MVAHGPLEELQLIPVLYTCLSDLGHSHSVAWRGLRRKSTLQRRGPQQPARFETSISQYSQEGPAVVEARKATAESKPGCAHYSVQTSPTFASPESTCVFGYGRPPFSLEHCSPALASSLAANPSTRECTWARSCTFPDPKKNPRGQKIAMHLGQHVTQRTPKPPQTLLQQSGT